MSAPAFGATLITRDKCTNSMIWAKEVLAQHPHGTLLHAANLLSARGRQARMWHIMPGQLLLTYLIKPNDTTSLTAPHAHGATPLTYLYYALNNGLYKALATFCPDAHIKWPNDCMVNGKKIAGMLIEPVWHGSTFAGMVLGIGVNVNNKIGEAHHLHPTATSMRMVNNNKPLDTTEVLSEINQQLTDWYEQWEKQKYQHIWYTWQKNHLPTGTVITVHRTDGSSVTGALQELRISGDLVLLVDGKKVVVDIGVASSPPDQS